MNCLVDWVFQQVCFTNWFTIFLNAYITHFNALIEEYEKVAADLIERGLVKLDAYNTTGSHFASNLIPFVEGPVAQRRRHLTTNQGIPGSNPGGVDFVFFTEKRYVEGLLISGYSTLIARMSL